MKEETYKAKIKDLNTKIKNIAEDCKAKGEVIESQKITIDSLKQINRNKVTEIKDLFDSLHILTSELEECKKLAEDDKEYHLKVSMKTKARLEILKQVLDDAINDRIDY